MALAMTEAIKKLIIDGVKRHIHLLKVCCGLCSYALWGVKSRKNKNLNVLLIMIDDLNDCIETLKGHPQTLTPNMSKLARSGVTFSMPIPMPPCVGSIQHDDGRLPPPLIEFFQAPWFKNSTLNNTRTSQSNSN